MAHPEKILEYRLTPNGAKAVVSGLLLILGIADVALVPVNIVLPIIYPVAVAGCLWTKSVRALWVTAFVAVTLALAVPHFALTPPLVNMSDVIFISRLTAVATILVVAFVVDRGIRTHLFAESQVIFLGDANDVLNGLNGELGLREAEIIRQNEELQSQTEELERQTEELRVTNEELSSWEHRLEQLLELARGLTANTRRSEVFSRICEALETLVHSHATAILLREGNELVVECHHGFGPEGLQSERISYHASFAGQVMQLGQTGYVEDIALRPDLKIPCPKSGAQLHAVLATPVKVDGKTIGTIEAYAHESRGWNGAEIALIESLAVQAGKSIQESELMEAVQFERRRFEAALRTVPIGLAISDDPWGHKVRINSAAASMFEVASNENISTSTALGSRLATRFHEIDGSRENSELPFAPSLKGNDMYAVEFEFRSQKGRRISLLVSAAPIFDDQQRITGAVAAFVDVTAQRILDRELELRRREAEEASLRKTRFLAAVSHDIRTPANAVNLMAEIIRRLAQSDSSNRNEIAEVATRLQSNIHVLLDLINDLLDVSRFDTGKMELTMTEFSLSELVQQEVNQVLPLAQDKQIGLSVDPHARPIWVRTDRVKLGRVLGNLLGNAVKFTDQGGVSVSYTSDHEKGRRVVIQISDSGIGMAPEHFDRIFDEFAQIQNPARDRSKGAGLGLSICKRIVELLGGTIKVKSLLNQGSVFTVELPASIIVLRTEVVPSVIVDRSPQSNRPLNIRILLIEDHTPTRDSTSRLLRDEGATVVEASLGQTAIELLKADEFDVALLDMMLPDIDGREILRATQTARSRTLKGILVLTGDLTQERLDEVKSLGADGLIGKPIDLEKLLLILRSY